MDLATLYMYKDIEMAVEFNESEISQILDAKKDYYQDEDYFAYLDAEPQKRWNFMKGTSLVLQGFDNFKKSDKCLRIELGKETDFTTRRQITNNLSVNCFENDGDDVKGWKWITQSLSEGLDVVDERMELLQQFIIGGEHLMIPNDDYFESLVDLFKEQDIALILQNVCEHLVSKQIPKDV